MSPQSSSHMYPPMRSSLSSSRSVYTEHPTSSYSLHTSSSGFSLPNLKPLKLAAMAKLLDPFKRLCQYEIPAGGTCRDDGCEDMHLSRLVGTTEMGITEPSGDDTAEYLFNVMPGSWLLHHDVVSPSRIFSALQQVQHRTVNNPLRFEDRVTQALKSLRSTPT
ncbi:hypothetical protein GALMADRAFT_220915 [Galerina marginata CBS 339.88]|uniref:Putative zinc-finger domain-containing protein n=1 Tax=Galerina marginata (strain CBS 339.88) TaxID=685588 RepID=A0A067TSP5_GALM3|nr:hypothetical protein GALMADRAFT_220915 [Galerina marginata CBS 339.88]